MYHPNAELEQCRTDEYRGTPQELKYWDQRIPNEPLIERTFLLERPPVIYNRRLQTTSPCIGVNPKWLLLDNKLAEQSAEYWRNNLNGQKYQGLPLYDCPTKLTKKQLKQLRKKYPNQPWIYGTNKNVDAESKLLALDYYNPEDCINSKVDKKLHEQNIIANTRLYNKYHRVTNNYLTHTPFYWDNTSKMRMQEPIDFDYTAYLNQCAQKRGLWNQNVA